MWPTLLLMLPALFDLALLPGHHLMACRTRRSPLSTIELRSPVVDEDAEVEQQREQTRLRELSQYWLAMCSAVALTDATGLQPFSVPQGWMGSLSAPPTQSYTQEDIEQYIRRKEPALDALVDAAYEHAPSLCAPSAMLPLARLAAWTEQASWVRPLHSWKVDSSVGDAAALRSLVSHLLERWPVPEALHGALAFSNEQQPVSEASHRVSRAFLSVHVAAGSGDSSVLAALRTAVAPCVTKAAAKAFVQMGEGADEATAAAGEAASLETLRHPLHCLRRAQVLALGGSETIADAACASTLGSAMQSDDNGEAFALTCLEWVVRHAEQLESPYAASATIDFFLEMRSLDDAYTCVGRTPKTVAAALEAFVSSSLGFHGSGGPSGSSSAPSFGRIEYDEAFQPNPRGLKGLFELEATIPAGTSITVPPYYYHPEGGTGLGEEGQPGSERATVRIAEILSLQRLFYEGERLYNCLEDSRRSQGKYLSRARSRVSSFWSLTRQMAGEDAVEHLCLIEVWHMGGGRNEIRQAEGPHPRTIPSAEAWYWLQKWCDREGIDLSTWDCYS
jgi:hypothetical protein